MKVFYFGCYKQLGHNFYDEHMRSSWTARNIVPWRLRVDGGLAPTIGPRRKYSQNEAPQGQAAIYHKDGWTAISFWDRSGDSRSNSSSTFLFEKILSFDEALSEAKDKFPILFARFPFEIVER